MRQNTHRNNKKTAKSKTRKRQFKILFKNLPDNVQKESQQLISRSKLG